MPIRKVIPRSLDSAAASANLNFDAGTLFVDSTNNRVGIGTSSPSTKLDVNGIITTTPGIGSSGQYVLGYGNNGSSRSWRMRSDSNAFGDFAIEQTTTQTGSTYAAKLLINPSGNVGIGTSSPAARLHVLDGSNGGTIQVGSSTVDFGTSRVNLYGSDNYIGFRHINVNAGNDIAYVRGFPGNLGTDSSGVLVFGTCPSGGTVAERMRIDSSGNVGIGSASPSSISGGRCLMLYNNSHATLSIQAVEGGNDRNATLELLSSGNGSSYSQILYGDTDTTPGTPSPLIFAGYHSGTRTERMRIDHNGNVAIGDSSSQYSAKLYVNGAIAARHGGVDGSFQNALVSAFTSNYAEKNIIGSAVSSDANNSGFRFSTSNGGGSAGTTPTTDILRNQVKNYVKRFGIGSATGASGFTSGKDLQLITWTGTKNNRTINLMTNSNLSEAPTSGIIGFSMMNSGAGTSRIYHFTTRFGAGNTLSQLQGGNRSAGEDASLTITCTGNDFGITFTSSGYPSNTGYVVWMIAGVQISNYSGNDKWLTD